MKSFKEIVQLTEAITKGSFKIGEHGELADKKSFDPANPDIKVNGVGIYKKQSLIKNIQDKLKSIENLSRQSNPDWIQILELVSTKGILNHLIMALIETQEELKTPLIKRRITLMTKPNKELDIVNMDEAAPPDQEIEKFIVDNKDKFKKQYGKEWEKILYAKAWKMFKDKGPAKK